MVRLEAARASIEETATRIDRGEGDDGALNTEGAIAKYFATEAGNAAADAAIQAHGGYGYTREYVVEKIKRDVRITTIYEGTSEIMEMTIARDRWQQHLKTRRRVLPRAGARAGRAARPAPGGRRGDRGPRHRGDGRRARGLPGRPAHPQPARAAAARRADRLGRVRRQPAPAAPPPRSTARSRRRPTAGSSPRRSRPSAASSPARRRKVADDGLRWVCGAADGGPT